MKSSACYRNHQHCNGTECNRVHTTQNDSLIHRVNERLTEPSGVVAVTVGHRTTIYRHEHAAMFRATSDPLSVEILHGRRWLTYTLRSESVNFQFGHSR